MENFPTVGDLANSSEEKVLRLWQGLGYYSRARNLHSAAKFIYYELKGQFPSTYKEIIKLKGVGPYTAAAIASICFDEPTPVVDGNVFRFASRYFGVKDDISLAGTRKVFEKLLDAIIPVDQAGTFNQAMMEFGATICSPAPDCKVCPFQLDCYAFSKSEQKVLPVKSKKTKVKDREFHYIVFRVNGNWLLNQRNSKDVWSGLYDFYLVEGAYEVEDLLNHLHESLGAIQWTLSNISGSFKHILSHQRIQASFYEISLAEESVRSITQNTSLNEYSTEEMLNLPKAKLIVNYLESQGIK